jgi:hypothetical protein
MSASRVFGEELDALGVWWPQGDGDALRESADAWQATADLLDDIARVLDAAAALVTENYRGEAASRFAALWARWSGEQGYLATTITDCRRLAVALADFATDVDVADRALVRLIEDALTVTALPTLIVLDEVWRTWLVDGAAVLGTDLGTRADHATGPLSVIVECATLAPQERVAIDPACITWPSMGTPADLSSLGTTPVDLGAGEGGLAAPGAPVPELPVAPARPPTLPPPLSQHVLPPSGTGRSGEGVYVVVEGDGNTVSVTIEQPNTMAPSLETLPGGDPLPEPPPIVEPLDTAPLGEQRAWNAGGVSVDPPPLESVATPLRLPDIPASTEPRELDMPIPVRVDPPGSGALAVGAAAGAAAAAASGASRMPFMPFMPMAGGMTSGGDEGNEPRRRASRRRPGA